MRRCDYCNKIYLADFKNCPLCGKHTIAWEPTTEKASAPSVKEMLNRIISYMTHMGD